MKIFLTGGTGFIGSHFLNLLSRQDHKVTALRRAESKPCIKIEKEPEWLVKEMDDLDVSDLEGCDTLVHLASIGVSPQVATWKELLYWNVTVLINLLEISLRELIVKCLAINDNWWKLLPSDVREHAEQRAERDSKFQKTMRMSKHSKIDQIDFADLERIFIKRDFWKNHFKDIFLDEKILSAKLQEISIMRNHVDHSKSLSRDNEERLRIYCKDILEMIQNYKKS